MRWAFEEIQREDGQSVYFRLSTRRSSSQGGRSPLTSKRRSSPAPTGSEGRARGRSSLSPIAARSPRKRSPPIASWRGYPEAGLLAITSPDRLHRDWQAARAHGKIGIAERLLAQLRPGAALVTVGDFHRRPCPGSAPSPAIGLSHWVSTALASQAISPTSIGIMASTPTRSSTPLPAPACFALR